MSFQPAEPRQRHLVPRYQNQALVERLLCLATWRTIHRAAAGLKPAVSRGTANCSKRTPPRGVRFSIFYFFDWSPCICFSTSRIACPFGEPMPVHASHPGFEAKSPFVPDEMSLNALCCASVV